MSGECTTVGNVIDELVRRVSQLEQRLDAIIANPEPVTTNPICVWAEDADGLWHDTCGVVWQCEYDTPKANSMEYCPRCGKPLSQQRCETYERHTRAVDPNELNRMSATDQELAGIADEPVTPPPDEVVEALRDEGMLIVKHYADLAAAVRELSWALVPYGDREPTDTERYKRACKTARVVEEMNG